MKKKIICIIICSVIFIINIFCVYVGIKGVNALNITYVSLSLTGNGTKDNPFLIQNENDLINLKNSVNSGENVLRKYFKLTCNINIVNFSGSIGTNDHKFNGYFDGCGNVISNLKSPLFGWKNRYYIKNLILSKPSISSNQDYTGALVCYADDTEINNVKVIGGNVTGEKFTGGVVGFITNCIVYDCENTASVKGSNFVGGIIGSANVTGWHYDSAKNSEVYEVINLLPSNVDGIYRCSNSGLITITSHEDPYAGGIVGVSVPRISDCYNLGNIKLDGSQTVNRCYIGGIVGAGVLDGVTVKTSYSLGTLPNVKMTNSNVLKQDRVVEHWKWKFGKGYVVVWSAKISVNVEWGSEKVNLSYIDGSFGKIENCYGKTSFSKGQENFYFKVKVTINSANEYYIKNNNLSNNDYEKTINYDGEWKATIKANYISQVDENNSNHLIHQLNVEYGDNGNSSAAHSYLVNCYDSGYGTENLYMNIPNGFSRDVWYCASYINNGYPVFKTKYWEGMA